MSVIFRDINLPELAEYKGRNFPDDAARLLASNILLQYTTLGKITPEDNYSLDILIQSPDVENTLVALTIIEEKLHQLTLKSEQQ